jgi:hypothetical protein
LFSDGSSIPRISEVTEDEPIGSVSLTSPTSTDAADGTVSETMLDTGMEFSVMTLGRSEAAAVDAAFVDLGFALGRNLPATRTAQKTGN